MKTYDELFVASQAAQREVKKCETNLGLLDNPLMEHNAQIELNIAKQKAATCRKEWNDYIIVNKLELAIENVNASIADLKGTDREWMSQSCKSLFSDSLACLEEDIKMLQRLKSSLQDETELAVEQQALRAKVRDVLNYPSNTNKEI